MSHSTVKEYSLGEFADLIRSGLRRLLFRVKSISILTFSFAAIGFLTTFFYSPEYISRLTFINEVGNNELGSSNISAFIGLDVAPNSNDAFAGDNLFEILRSRMMIRNVLLDTVVYSGKRKSFLDIYINNHYGKIELSSGRGIDSIINLVYNRVLGKLSIYQNDKKLNLTTIELHDKDEFFAKTFIETLSAEAIQYFKKYKSLRARKNYELLSVQSDSLRRILSQDMDIMATMNDNQINAKRQIAKSQSQFQNINIQNTLIVYQDINKQLQSAKLTLLRETPLIQIIDIPVYPLEKRALNVVLTVFLFALIGFTIICMYWLYKE
jgi:hypothetical protein